MKAEYVASISYGKDSIVIPELCKRHNLQLDRLVHIEVMANNDTPACIPIVSEFKKHANDILYDKHGLTVDVIHPEHTFEDMFYTRIKRKSSKRNGQIYGFPLAISSYCVTEFKTKPMRSIYESGAYVYLGLCSDEEKRYNNAHNKNPNILSPAYMFNYTEQDCKEIAKSLDLLSPTYEYSMRDGCFFCPKQSINQIRYLYHNCPELWNMMLRWDESYPMSNTANFWADHTIHELNKRFEWEDINKDKLFKWKYIND